MAPPFEPEYIYGLHDPGGEHIMLEKGIPGWVVVTEGVGYNASDQGGKDYNYLSGQGLGVIVRLNAGYGGVGTIPFERFYNDFAQRCGNFVRNSQGAGIWIVGNEMNHPIEWPGADWNWDAAPPAPRGPDKEGEKLTPQRYAGCFSLVRNAIRSQPGHEEDRVLLGAVAPWNNLTKYPGNESGDWVKYFVDLLREVGPGGCDGITLHTYTHGHETHKLDAADKMGSPFQHRHYHFRAYRDFMEAIPADMRQLPVYVTETDQDVPWVNENKGWVRRAYGEIDYWNKNNPQQIRALILYRWPKYDKWYIEGKQGVIDDFRMAMDWKLKWRKDAAPEPTGKPYQAQITLQQAPATGQAGSETFIDVIVRNVGNNEWPNSGSNPVRVGYRWYDAAGSAVAAADFRTALPQTLRPGEQTTVRARVGLPQSGGEYTLAVDLVHEGITWFADKGSALAKTKMTITGQALPSEQFFAETKVWVRGPFLDFYRRYGLDICGYPITEAFREGGMAVQYFQRVALEEYETGKVRLRLTASQAYEAAQRIQALEQRLQALQRQIQQGGGGMAPPPAIQDITNQLPRDPARMFTRDPGAIKHIVINHTAVRAGVEIKRIADAHRKQWPAIVCQYYIEGDGAIYQTNPLNEVVDNQQAWLHNGVNIHVAGNFTDAIPTPAQMDALASLCAWLLDTYGLETTAVQGTQEFVVTASPGKQWLSGQMWKQQLVERIQPLRGSGPGGQGMQPDPALQQRITQLQQERDALSRQVQEAAGQVAFLTSRVTALEAALQQGGSGGGIAQPAVTDVITTLPRDAARMIKRKESDIKYIVIHHTAAPGSVGVERVAQAHKARWPAIVCQFFIDGAGKILQTNPINEVVDDKQDWLLGGINIHVAGNFNADIPTDAQLTSLASLCAWLMQSYKLGDESVRGVREFIVTQSPGEQWSAGQNWRAIVFERLKAIRASAATQAGGASTAALQALRAQLQQLQTANQDMTRRLQEAEAKLRDWTQQTGAADAAALRTQLAALQGQVATLQKQITALQATNADLTKRLKEAEARATPADTSALRSQITQLQNEKQALVQERASQKSAITDLQRQLADMQRMIEELRRTPPIPIPIDGQSGAPGVITKPAMEEIVDQLAKSPTDRYPSRTLSQITHIAIHHSAAPANTTPETIANYHVKNPSHLWPGMGYHYYIGPDGKIYHTQDLTLSSYQVYKNNHYSLGICVAGSFMDVIPTPAQLTATARLVAWLMQELKVPIENVWGHKEFPLNATACPGNQWLAGQKWKSLLLDEVRAVQSGRASAPLTKGVYHYLLFWKHDGVWAQQDWQGALGYIGRFNPTAGFSVADAKNAQHVTIVGGVAGVSQQDEDALRAAGCKVERLAGKDFAETKAMLDRMAETGQRFLNLGSS